MRLKKMVATFALVAFIIIYMLVIMVVAQAKLHDASGVVHFFFFLFFGLIWIVPAGGIMWWGWRNKPEVSD